MANQVDDTYATQQQIEFAREMAKALLQRKSTFAGAGPEGWKTPYAWTLTAGDMIDQLAGAQYRDIAGNQEKKKALEPYGYQVKPPDRYGGWVNPKKASVLKPTAPTATGAVTPEEDEKQLTATEGAGPITPKWIQAVRHIESGGKDNLTNKYGYRGPFQFSREEEKKYGIDDKNWNHYPTAEKAFIARSNDIAKEFASIMGRSPNGGEIYLAHNQGVGGATAHLKNPDQPAWKSMLSTAEGRAKGEAWAKRAIRENLPAHLRSLPDDKITSGMFAKAWTDRPEFRDTGQVETASIPEKMGAAGPETGATGVGREYASEETTAKLFDDFQRAKEEGKVGLDETGRSNLGGPKPDGSFDVAQSFETVPSVPGTTAGKKMIKIPGYTGEAPDVPYVETKEEIARQALAAGSPKERQDIMDKWQSKQVPFEVEVPDGRLQVTPKQGGGGTYKFFASGKKEGLTPESVPIYPDIDEDGNKVYRMMLPGSTSKTFGSMKEARAAYDEWIKLGQDVKRRGTVEEKLAEGSSEHINAIKEHGLQSYSAARTLDQMIALSKSTGDSMLFGPSKDLMIKFGQYYDNFIRKKGEPSWKELPEAETMDKLNSVLASESTRAFNTRGTNFDLMTFMKNNPGLGNTKAGRELLLDIMKQDAIAKGEIGVMVSKIPGESVTSLNSKIKEYYDQNPIIVTLPTNGKKIVMKQLTKEERDALEPGVGYIAPDGKVRYKAANP